MSGEKEVSKLKVKRVVEREVKKAPPPTPPRYRYVAIHSAGEEPFSYEPLVRFFRKHRPIRRKSTNRLIIYLLLVNSIIGMSLLYTFTIFCVQTILNGVNVIRIDSDTIKIEVEGNNWFTTTILNVLTKTSIRSIPSNNTASLRYADGLNFVIDSNDVLLVVNVRAELLGIVLVEGKRYYGL
ncbi:hypothetical protein KEJ17_01505 [Candidatus Bathyarchaeota archaeon]|nr:hypothetical protein [Candidatus Bathyarchaeota archaeon]